MKGQPKSSVPTCPVMAWSCGAAGNATGGPWRQPGTAARRWGSPGGGAHRAHEPEAGGSLILARLLRVSRHDHLTSMSGSADPSRGVDRKPDVVHVVERRIATVEPDADLDLGTIRPTSAALALQAIAAWKREPGLSNTTRIVARVSTAWPANATAVSRSSVRTPPITRYCSPKRWTRPEESSTSVISMVRKPSVARPGGALDVPQGRSESSWLAMNPRGTIPCFFAAVSNRVRARARAVSSSNRTWVNRASAFRTWAASWIGSRRRPRGVDVRERVD